MHSTMIIRDRETGQALAEIDSATVARNKLLPHLEAVTPLRHLQDLNRHCTRAALAAMGVRHADRQAPHADTAAELRGLGYKLTIEVTDNE